jgi:hygromycin-B 4-O-kinase
MKSFKLDMNCDEAIEKLTNILGNGVSNVRAIEMGELSRVFSFEYNSNQQIVHFKDSRESFDKARYIHETYSSPTIPIPKVIKIGEVDHVYYAISEKAKGKPITHFEGDPRIKEILDSLSNCYTALNDTEVDSSQGFGWISPSGLANSKDWTQTLASFFDEHTEGFHKDWTNLYTDSFLEKSLFEEGLTAMLELSSYSPSEPYLVHGDFHLGNMISNGKEVTGIVDWEMAMYGDFMFDLAGLHFWAPDLNFPTLVRNKWLEKGRDIVHFEERLRCHQLFKAVDGLRFYAKQDALSGYNLMKERVIMLLQ